MATYYFVEMSNKPGHSRYEAVVVREYFKRKFSFPYLSSEKIWYVPISSLDYDDWKAGRNQYRFRKWLMQHIRGVTPDRVNRY